MQVTGADFNVAARGDNQLRANKMLVLVDGRSIYLDTQGEVLWKNIPVTLPEIKRIEVLKGPAAALYGFNAFDGVINIITKSAAEMKGVTLQFGGGEYGTISGAAIVAGVHNGRPDVALARIAKGFRFVTVASDARILAAGSQEILKAMRAGPAPAPASGY